MKQAEHRATKVSERHEEMIKPVSEKMQKKLKEFRKKEKNVQEKSWCQQMSFESQMRADRFLKPAETRWMALEKEDRDTIQTLCQNRASRDIVEFLRPLQGQKVWCIKNTRVLLNGLHSDSFRKALRKDPVLFAAALFGGYLVDRTWLQKAEEYHGITGELVEPHWKLKGSVQKPLELFVDASFREHEEFTKFSSIIKEAQSDRWVQNKDMAHGSLLSHWTVRDARKEIRQQKLGIVLFGSKDGAKDSAKNMKTKKAAVKKLENKVKELRAKNPKPLALMATVQQLKEARQSATLKGSPVGPKKFFERVAQMVALQRIS